MSRLGFTRVPARCGVAALCLVMAGGPALAGPFGGFGPPIGGAAAAGLFGGLALGMMAGAAQRQQPTIVEEIAPEPDETIVIERAPARLYAPPRRAALARLPAAPEERVERPARPARAMAERPAALASCRDALARAARPYGGKLVSFAPAAAGAGSVTVKARVRYGDGAKGETRDAQVTCRLNGAGEVVALR